MDSTIVFFIFSNVTIDSLSIHVKLILKNRNFQAINISKIRKTFSMKSIVSISATTFLDNDVLCYSTINNNDMCIKDSYYSNQSNELKEKMFSKKIKPFDSTILTNEINKEKESWQLILENIFLKQENHNIPSQDNLRELLLLLESKHSIKALPIKDISNLLEKTEYSFA